MHAKSTYTVKKWDEKPYEEISSSMKMTKASVEFEMSGELIAPTFMSGNKNTQREYGFSHNSKN